MQEPKKVADTFTANSEELTPRTKTSLQLNSELYRQFKHLATDEGKKLGDLMDEAMEFLLKNRNT